MSAQLGAILPSWMILSDDALYCLSHINILYDCILPDHHLILFNANLDVSPDIIKSSSNELTQRFRWNELSLAMIEQYRISTSNSLECIKVPDCIKCTDANCKLVFIDRILIICIKTTLKKHGKF